MNFSRISMLAEPRGANVLHAVPRLVARGKPRRTRLPAFTAQVVAMVTALAFQAPTGATETIDYLKQIKPILAERCYACHGALKQEGDLRVDTAGLAAQGGVSGPAIEAGNAEASLLLQRIESAHASERMPAEGKPLPADQIAAIRRWIEAGASAPPDEAPELDPKEHWAFKPVARPVVPVVANQAWVHNPIDAFISLQHERHGLKPQREANSEVLVRRLSIDLIGLPPDEAMAQRAMSDPSNSWYDSLVDQLLNDPRHGERWARHWMDIWRYSDWWGLGEQVRSSQPHIWHWRDWIVESLNANMPYDEMLRLMLAADELHPNDLDKLRATGYLARNWGLFTRDLWMDETVEHVGKSLLGLTMNCAKCHDHKFDPIEQVDYYRMRAFFEPYHVRNDMAPGEPDLARDGIPRAFDGVLDAPTYLFERGQESLPDKSTVIKPGVPEIVAFADVHIEKVSLPVEAWQPERRPWALESHLAAAQKAAQAAHEATKEADEKRKTAAQCAEDVAVAEIHSVAARANAMRARWLADAAHPAGESATVSPSTELAVRAERLVALAKAAQAVNNVESRLSGAAEDAKAPIEAELAAARDAIAKAQAAAEAPVVSTDAFTPLVGAQWAATRFLNSTADDPTVTFPAESTGRRSALAAWITHPENPLTARVAVNHLWARHMGVPLVASVFDFGRKGNQPTHPELLDWLAAELIESGWDMKHLHRLIVTSSTYRMSSSAIDCDEQLVNDADNIRLWRRTPIRVESQVVRDSILFLTGELDPKRGGPPVPMAEQTASKRRSLYFFHSNNERNSFLTTFDEAGVKECYVREQSIVPQQALALSNSALVHDASRNIAERLSLPNVPESSPPDDREFIRRVFQTVLCMRAGDQEIDSCLKTLALLRSQTSAPNEGEGASDRSREHLIWALFNHNDFVTLR